MLDGSQGQPGFTALTPVRARGTEPSVAAFEIVLDDQQRNRRGDLVVDLVRHQEAGIVAAILRRLIGAYPVWDNDCLLYTSYTHRNIGSPR